MPNTVSTSRPVGTPEQRRQWDAATARLAAAGLPGTVGPGMLTIAQANAMIAKNRAGLAQQNRAQQIADKAAAKLAMTAAQAQVKSDKLAVQQSNKNAQLVQAQQNAATQAQLQAQKHANVVTNQITQFETTLLKQANNPLDYKGRNIFNPGRQAGLNAEQQAFANKIAKEGGYYQPVPLDTISNVLKQAENAVALYSPIPDATGQTPVTTGAGTVIVQTPSGINAVPPTVGTPVITGVNDTPTQTPLPYIGPGGVPIDSSGGSSGTPVSNGSGSAGGVYPGTTITSDGGTTGSTSLIPGVPDLITFAGAGLLLFLVIRKRKG